MPLLVNFGSLCIDWVYQVPNLVSAGVTTSSSSRATYPGGKGLNQSIAASLAGAQVLHFGAVGDDGGALVAALRQAGVNTKGVVTIDSASGHAVIQVDEAGQNGIVIYPGANQLIPSEQRDRAMNTLRSGDWLLLQNETNDVAAIITQAWELGIKVAVNLAPADDRIHGYPLQYAALLIVNEIEAMALAGCSEPHEAFTALKVRYPDMDIVLTLGREGLWCAVGGTGETLAGDAYSVTAVDETAAGDAFIGYLMAAIVMGKALPDALSEATAAGALTVTQAGASTSIPRREEVEALLANQRLVPYAQKIH